MRPQKIDDKALISGLMAVLSAKGYDGASLNDLAASSGLQKASLYHRFPGGKKEITRAVLQFVLEWTKEHIEEVLKDQKKSPTQRLHKALQNINELYNGGRSTCILRALSLDSGMNLFSLELEKTSTNWIESFCLLGKDFGMKDKESRKTAVHVLTKIQGSLVVSKMLHDQQIFKEALTEITALYTKK